MLLKSIKWMLNPKSPLYIQPRANRKLIAWLWRFLRSMNHAQMNASIDALVELSKLSLEIYKKLDEEEPGAFGFTQRGLLMVAQTPQNLASVIQEMQLVGARGVKGCQMDPDQIQKLEPAIRANSVIGGVFFPDEAHVEPLATVRHIFSRALAAGTQVRLGTEVLDFHIQNGLVRSVLTTRGEIKADKIVLAAGSWSGRLSAKLALNLPILSGKGYAAIVPPPPRMPQIPIMLLDRKVAITPRAGSMRIAGTLELVDLDETVNLTRVKTLLDGAETILDLPPPIVTTEIWRGLRPCAPDGVPVIGKTPQFANVIIAAGHQMLGMQTGTATGRLVADLVTGQSPCVNPEPFRVSRFR
jgi:D-amino-acid dehydrogenase